MRAAIIYHSKTGRTKQCAELISKGLKDAGIMEVMIMDIDNVDAGWLASADIVIFGTPTYYASCSWQIKKWFDTSWEINLEGKLGAVFATADYIGGGAENAIMTVAGHMLVKGMMVYSGGSAIGQPYLHLGLVMLSNNIGNGSENAVIFGSRIGKRALKL